MTAVFIPPLKPKPPPDPLSLAVLHELDTKRCSEALVVHRNIIAQILVGRRIRNTMDHRCYWITAITLTPGGTVTIRGTPRKKGVERDCGTLTTVEII